MLNTYLTATQNLLQNPQAPNSLYTTPNLTTYINTARGQLAGEAECVVAIGTLTLTAGVNVYPFSSIVIPNAAVLGIQQPVNVRTAWYTVGGGQKWIRPRNFPWFSLYELNNPVPKSGPPYVWSQYGQGVNGSIYFNMPDYAYTVPLDCQCLPIPLATEADPEAIPALWTDAVPYFAAYLALMSAQTGVRTQEALGMFKLYQEFVSRARRAATPSVAPTQYSQVSSPMKSYSNSGNAPEAGG